MGTNISPVLRRELENLDKGADSRKSAMKALKSCVEDLDCKAIPLFLARVSETKETGSSPGECTISLYETLAIVHGPDIVPHIDDIMSTIVRTLSSIAGSFALHQACCKVVPAIARYGIDPLTPENEKTRIIRALAKPLSDVLMGPMESAASGAALCLEALVESDNWQFASDDMVNEVCLKVAGALEEKPTQTNSHMGLVVALSKHNGLITEAYARSLIRSGLRILTAGVKENDPQKQLQAIQMIDFLMQGVDSRSISSEIFKVVDAMENCQNDSIRSVRVAASKAIRTAKMISGQKVSRHEIFPSTFMDSNFDRRYNRKHSWIARDNADERAPGSFAEFPSPESQTVDSFVDYDTLVDSPMSMGHCNFDCARHVNRRLWSNGNGGVDTTLKDGFFHKSGFREDTSMMCSEHTSNGELCEMHKELSEASSGFVQPTAMGDTTPSPQRSKPHLSVDDVRISSTPRKLIRSLQDSTDTDPEGLGRQDTMVPTSPTSSESESNPTMTPDEDGHSRNLNNCELQVKRITARMRKLTKQNDTEEDMSSILDAIPADGAGCEDRSQVRVLNTKTRSGCSKAALGIVCCLCVIVVAIILPTRWIENDEGFPNVVPT